MSKSEFERMYVHICGQAASAFNKAGYHVPMFFYPLNGGIEMVQAPWESQEDKQRIIAAIRTRLRNANAPYYVYATEVSIFRKGALAQLYDELYVIGEDRSGHILASAWRIDRSTAKPRVVGEPTDRSDITPVGVLSNLLGGRILH